MRLNKYIILILGISLFFSCKSKYPLTAEVSYLRTDAPGVVVVESFGYGNTKEEAEEDCFHTAFQTIFFKGLPKYGGLRLPMIEDQKAIEKEHPHFLRSFYDKREYMQFVTMQGKPVQVNKRNKVEGIKMKKSMAINYVALKKYLEREEIIRKFGY